VDFKTQILFLFSALGGFNALFLSIYFVFFSKKKQASNYFLSALLLVLSIRILKSVFKYFNPGLSQIFIQIGLSACTLIGPFLYLYIVSLTRKISNKKWILHCIPTIVIITVLGFFYGYWDYKIMWSRYIVKLIYLQWFIYILFSGIILKPVFKRFLSKKETLRDIEIWILTIYFGVVIIWLGYNIGSYTSYIVGALSFSFVLCLLILFWVFKKRKNTLFFEDKIKYENKKIIADEAETLRLNLHSLMSEKKMYTDANLKLNDVARELKILPHYLSQFLNDNLKQSFSMFVNEYRIEEAKKLLVTKNTYTTEAIGYECGFNSKSTFFTTFKKITGSTPASYRNKKA